MHRLMSLQRDLDERFGARDRQSGPEFLALVLMEEVGELAEALRRGDREHAKEEVGDVAFVAYALANVLGADVEAQVRAKFLARRKDDVTRSWTDLPS
ncbi:MAG TPA: MazG nucleotide pyrophosphohydrolase domain-containing protein [Candidatus Thermoplasmatota archaeon]|nr:MazG nucleotide pyrophosphohydrolase domain-containing protein [Candidatus Thermoplasmatota archaeon]